MAKLLGKEVTDALNADLQMRIAALREKGVVPTLGITLLPQAGVALDMALTAASLAGGTLARNVILFSVLVSPI